MRLFIEDHASLIVVRGDEYLDGLCFGGGDVFAHKVSPEGQLSVSPVDKYGELDAGWAPKRKHGLDGGADCTPGVEHVVHDDDPSALNIKGKAEIADNRALRCLAKIVPVIVYVDAGAGDVNALNALDVVPYHLRERLAAAQHADYTGVVSPFVLLQNFVGDADNGAANGGVIHYLGLEFHLSVLLTAKNKSCRKHGKIKRNT